MRSLYHSLLARHPRQLKPVRCAPSTIAQLHRYFEEVVLEHNLGSLIVECLPTVEERSNREITRVRELVQAARKVFLFVTADDALADRKLTSATENEQPVVLEGIASDNLQERLVVIAGAHFSALLVSIANPDDNFDLVGDLVVWTFDPEVVSSALESLIARVSSEDSLKAASFAEAVHDSTPKAASPQLTSGITTKLVRLLQEQAEREVAVSRIATAIRNSLELDRILVTAAHEVGRTLNAKCCAVQVEGHLVRETLAKFYFRSKLVASQETKKELVADIELLRVNLPHAPTTWVVDGDGNSGSNVRAKAAVPLTYQGNFVGLLLVHSADASHIWADNELLLLHTVADQLTVAVNQAHMQEQALTDGLTGCYNRRSFELQLERDLHLATRMRQPLSLIMMDLDRFKRINDRAGHDIGDVALRIVAESLRAELRAVDSAARFGGDEFAVILPQAGADGALVVAERLRKRIAGTEVPGFGFITASFGLATFPDHASSRDTLVVAADRALYNSKHTGRNRISTPLDDGCEPVSDTLTHPDTTLEMESIAETLLRL
jgi:diguanylate cyclase (GGDEF)-like protein